MINNIPSTRLQNNNQNKTLQAKNIDPQEARSAVDVLTNDEVAQAILDLKAAVSAFGNFNGENDPNNVNISEIISNINSSVKNILAGNELATEIAALKATLGAFQGNNNDSVNNNSKSLNLNA